MAEAHLVYKLDGELNEINVFQLAPTLLALGELIRESNNSIFPEGREIGVNVKPFRQGSFIVDFTLASPDNLHKLIEFLKPHTLEQLKTLLECIGLVVGGTTAGTVGVIRAIRKLKGRPQLVEPAAPGEVRYTSKDGTSFTVKQEVHVLLSNPNIVQNVFNIYAPMLENPGISDIKTFMNGEEKGTEVSVKADEVGPMREFAEAVKEASESETTKEVTTTGVLLNPKRGAFEDDPKDWSFRRGGEIITATIKDREFLAKYAAGVIRLNSSDLLTVELLERQKLKGTIVQKPSYEIIKVTDYKKGPTQSKLLS